MLGFIVRHKVGAATIIAALAVAALTLYAVPFNPPLGDCFGGTLSPNPLYCYALEQARRQGVIDIHAIYDVNGSLYVSITTESPGARLDNYLMAKLTEFLYRWPDDLTGLSFPDDECRSVYDRTTYYWECYLSQVARKGRYLTRSMEYSEIRFFYGEDVALRLTPGWAYYRQLWPATTSSASDASTTPATFDVSDVDMTNLPVDYACPDKLYGHRYDICSRDQNVALSILDTRSQDGTDGNKYIEYIDPPEDAAQAIALKKIIDPCYGVSWGACEWTATATFRESETTYVARTMKKATSVTEPGYDDIVLIPVKHNRGELRRWVEILNRFALSTSNTVGLYEATIDDNKDVKKFEVVFTSAGPGPARMTEDGGYDLSKVRTTILLVGFDPHRLADALPTLLPLLGIPTDAVGVVGRRKDPGYYIHRHDGGFEGPSRATEIATYYLDVPMPPLLLARNVVAVLVAGGVVALALRLRRWVRDARSEKDAAASQAAIHADE